MAKTRTLEERLETLNALRSEPSSERTASELQAALASKANALVARAAEIAGEFLLESLEVPLTKAFERFMVNPTKTDKGCLAKTAIVDALYRMESPRTEVYLEGIHHVQMEPVWGGREDTAPHLRGVSALALVRANYPQVLLELAQLLADPQPEARVMAARAIGYTGADAGIPLLRFKALVGDAHPQVLCECFGALLKLDPEPGLSFVAGFLQHDSQPLREAAAVALGESRLVQAFHFLEAAWEDSFDPELRQTLLVAMAMLHQERAFALLLTMIGEGPAVHARSALRAMEMYRGDVTLWSRVRAALDSRTSPL